MITQFLNPFMLTITASLLPIFKSLHANNYGQSAAAWGGDRDDQRLAGDVTAPPPWTINEVQSLKGRSRGCGLAWKFPVEAILHHVYVLAGKNHFKRFNDTVSLLKPY